MKRTITYTDYDGVEKREEHDFKMWPRFGKCLGYSNASCPNCGRYRLEWYESGKTVCEKCNWCPEEQCYVSWDVIYAEEHWSTLSNIWPGIQ